ncbi:MAG: SusD/RagB family nutrient-binding outer membrane lipoprotein [Muribaculaceae bacterium]|nr:SusD/RagB family nutrient-binding outer membrane lipoprotein [Muribaculaceae bacterium]
MINKIKLLAFGALLGLAGTSCNDTLKENINPDRPHDTTAQVCLPVVCFYSSQINYDHSEYNIFLSQCLTTMSNATSDSFPYKSGWQFLTVNRHPMWRRHFYDIGVNVNNLVRKSQEMGSPNYELIGRAVRLMSTQLTTDAWGDMPRSEAYLTNSPKYDTQAEIYAWMLDEADELIRLFDDAEWGKNPNNLEIDKSQDRIYAGDMNKWKGLVQAIKARLLLRNVPNVDRSAATLNKIANAAQAAIDTWRTGDLQYGEWFGNEPRYYYEEGGIGEGTCPWSAAQPVINAWESRPNNLTTAVPSKFFIQDCLGVIDPGNENKQGFWDNNNGYGADPRLMLLLKPQDGPISAANDTKRVMIRYLENNIGSGSTFKQTNYPDLYCGAYAAAKGAYNMLFTMEELYFIKAEALYWLGNKTEACALAKEAATWNIQRHLDRYLQDSGNVYPGPGNLPVNTNATQQRFERIVHAFLENEADGRTKACSEIGNKHYFFDASTYTLSDLMIQKYIALYMQPEQWTDMRRYHFSNNRNGYGIGDANEIVYPTLRRPYNLYAAYWIDGLTIAEQENTWVQRLNYDPETEEKYNLAELERLGASKNPMWLRKPMIWAEAYGVRSSLTQD